MPWLKMDDNFITNPKLFRLSPEYKALYFWFCGYSAKELTDGVIELHLIPVISAMVGISNYEPGIQQMVQARLLEWDEGRQAYRIHDYLEYNPTREQVLQDRAAAKERMQKLRSQDVRPNVPRTEREVPVKLTDPVPDPVPVPVPISDSPNGESDAPKRVQPQKPMQDRVREVQLELNKPTSNKSAIVHRLTYELYGRAPTYGHIGKAATKVGGYGILVDLLAQNVNKANGCPVAYAETVWKARNRENGRARGPTLLQPDPFTPEPDVGPVEEVQLVKACAHNKVWSRELHRNYCPKCEPAGPSPN